MEGGKVKQGLYVGEIKEDGVEGAAASTPALLELIKGGDLGFACFFKFMGKPLPAPPAFDDMDADGDGELTAEEILSLIFLGETVGVEGCVGGALFIAACFLAATAPEPDPNCGVDNCEV